MEEFEFLCRHDIAKRALDYALEVAYLKEEIPQIEDQEAIHPKSTT